MIINILSTISMCKNVIFSFLRQVTRYENCCVLYFILLQSGYCLYQNCIEETSQAINGSFVIKWVPLNLSEDYLTLSHPPCLDPKGQLIIRKCVNGSWIPKTANFCASILSNNRDCPNYFIESEVCTLLTEPTYWNDKCILSQHIKKSPYSTSTKKFENASIWLPAKRRVKYGPYEYTTEDEKYGEIINKNYTIEHVEDLFNKDCLLFHPLLKGLVPEYCNKLYPHVCIYQKHALPKKCPDKCISAGLGLNYCYCKVYNNLCSHYASIKSPFDKHQLSKFAGHELCKLNNSQLISNSIWKESTDFVECNICSYNLQDTKAIQATKAAKPILTFNKSKTKLTLTVYFPEDIFTVNDKEGIYCFTNAAEEKMNKTIKLNKILASNNRKTLGISEESVYVYELRLEKFMGLYNCQVHRKHNFSEILYSNTVVAYQKKKGNEYSLRLKINNSCIMFNCGDFINIPFVKFIHPGVNSLFKPLDSVIRVMEIFNFDINSGMVDMLLHVTTNRDRKVIPEYFKMYDNLIHSNFANTTIIYFRNSEFCMPLKTSYNNISLTWPKMTIGESTLPSEICYSEDIPFYKICQGSFLYGGYWSDTLGKCNSNKPTSELTDYLYSVSKEKNITSAEKLKTIGEKINNTTLSVQDLFYIGKILQALDSLEIIDNNLMEAFVGVTNSLINIPRNISRKVQSAFNTTDTILDVTERILSKQTDNHTKLFFHNNIFVYITKPFLSNISGISIYTNASGDYNLKPIRRQKRFQDLHNQTDLKLASYIPEDVLEQIFNTTMGNVTNITLIISIFRNDNLFVSDSKYSVGQVISISIPGYGSFLKKSVPILFRTNKTSMLNPSCVYWDYGKDTQRHPGTWSDLGSNFIGHFAVDEELIICSFAHLTHFALVIDRSSLIILGHRNYFILNLIIHIGFSLSIIGIVGIFATAIIFEKWRRKTGTKILLHLSAAITFQAISLEIKDVDYINSYSSCLISGILMHYMLISKFCWMLVYAYLQYLRFVKVLGPQPKKLILKSVLFGWGVGLISVLLTAFENPYSYKDNDEEICFPKGLPLYVGIFLPVTIIIMTNTIIFGIVMFEVWNRRVESNGNLSKNKLQVKLAILLFFIFGMPWIFGILSELVSVYWVRLIFLYIFYITSSVEQFILFLFYVVLNDETRNKWKQILNISKSV